MPGLNKSNRIDCRFREIIFWNIQENKLPEGEIEAR
jgi:hypothetical protein